MQCEFNMINRLMIVNCSKMLPKLYPKVHIKKCHFVYNYFCSNVKPLSETNDIFITSLTATDALYTAG